jgi:hypothetical protein
MTTKVVRIFESNNSMHLADTLDGQIDVVKHSPAYAGHRCLEGVLWNSRARGATARAPNTHGKNSRRDRSE